MLLTIAFLFALAGNATLAWVFGWLALGFGILNIILSLIIKIAALY